MAIWISNFCSEVYNYPQHAQWTLNKIENTTGLPQDERVCFRGSEYILFEILD